MWGCNQVFVCLSWRHWIGKDCTHSCAKFGAQVYIAQHDQMMTTCQIAILVAFFYAGSLHCQHDFYDKYLLADSKTFLSSLHASFPVLYGLDCILYGHKNLNMLFFSTCFFYVILGLLYHHIWTHVLWVSCVIVLNQPQSYNLIHWTSSAYSNDITCLCE